MDSTDREPESRARPDLLYVLAAVLVGFWIGQGWLLLHK